MKCEACGAKMVEYKHNINKPLLHGLTALFNAGGESNLKHLHLDRSQWDNFQKLRYWGLVEKFKDDKGNRIAGTWTITAKGRDFLFNRVSVQKSTWTYRGDFKRYDGEHIYAKDIDDISYKIREEYASEAMAHSSDNALFMCDASH